MFKKEGLCFADPYFLSKFVVKNKVNNNQYA